MKRLSCLLLLVAACGPQKPLPQQRETPVVINVPPAPSASPVATAAPAKSASPPEEAATEPDCSEAAFSAAEKELEAAITRNNPDEIVEKFDKALFIHTRDVALRNRYLKFLLDRGLDGSEEARILVAIGDDTNAQALTLLGIDAENNNDKELSRAYFARAAASDPKSDGAVRLGKRSRCTGAFARAAADSPKLDIAKGWLGLFEIVDAQRMVREEDKPEPKTEAEARKRVCINNTLNEITEHDVCQGNGPWTVQTGHMHFHDHRVIIVPLPRNRFAIVPYFTGLGCRGGSEASATVLGEIIQIQTTSLVSVVSEASPCDEGMHDALTGPCINGSEFDSAYYDAATGKHLATITELSSREKHVIKGGKLTRTEGSFCNERVDLRALGAVK